MTVAQSALMNDTQNLQVPVQPRKTYFLRIVNMAAFAAQYFWIEGHTFRIIEVDGEYHEPTEASMIYVTAAQRYGVLLTTKNDTSENFAMMGSMDQDHFDQVPDGLNPNVTSFLVYDADKPMPTPKLIDQFDPFDDMTLVPTDGEELFEDPDLVVQLVVLMDNLGDGAVSLSLLQVPFLETFYLPTSLCRTTLSSAVSPTSGPRSHPFIQHYLPESSRSTHLSTE